MILQVMTTFKFCNGIDIRIEFAHIEGFTATVTREISEVLNRLRI